MLILDVGLLTRVQVGLACSAVNVQVNCGGAVDRKDLTSWPAKDKIEEKQMKASSIFLVALVASCIMP